MHHRKAIYTALISLAGAAGATACGGDFDEGAVLTLVGDRSLRVDAGASIELVVRYHDPSGVPLAGEVEFTLHGEHPADVSLDARLVQTDEIGAVSVVLDTGAAGDFELEVRAEAPGAKAASWEISVDPIPPLELNGAYALHSSLDVAAGLPGNVGRAVNLVIDITEGPGAPTRWIVYQIIERLPESLQFEPPNFLIQAVNGLLLSVAPNIVSRLLDAGEAFGGIATDFGVTTRLEIEGEPGARTATHTITGFVLNYGNQAHEFSLEEVGLSESPVSGIGVRFDEDLGELVIDEHELQVSYGTFLIFALDHLLLRGVDGSLGDFLQTEIDCAAIAQRIADELGRGAIFREAVRVACNEGLKRAGDRIVDAFIGEDGIDGVGMTLRIAGGAIAEDSDGDRFIDLITAGTWEGQVQVGERVSGLGRDDNTFSARRIGD